MGPQALSRILASVVALVVALVVLSIPGTQASTAAAPTWSVAAAERGSVSLAGSRADNAAKNGRNRGRAKSSFRPRPGPVFNNPVAGTDKRRTIFRKIMRSIDATPQGQEIKIFTWNFLTSEGTDALLRAQRRGVRVRLLMDKRNNTEVPNGPYRRLRAGLMRVNEERPNGRRSWARVCQGSCRGNNGSAHSKFFMFSKVGPTPRVVMQGSANFTLASTNNQWNDIYTHTRSERVWQFFSKTFREAVADEPARPAYLSQSFENFRLVMFPSIGSAAKDPVMQMLNRVRCRGAKNTGTGRTRIRIAPDVIRQDRGMRLGRKVRQLWDNGCDVRIGYTVMGIDVGRMLRAGGGRGPVPLRHLVQDTNNDGEFDNYFHLKAMSIVGHMAGNRRAYAVLNGSANWSGLGGISDENLGIYQNRGDARAYQNHIDYWYNRFGSSSARTATSMRAGVGVLPAPTSEQLVFGTGANAIYEDGTPYSTEGVDPYASLDLD